MPTHSFDIRIGSDADPDDAALDPRRPLEVLIAGDFTGRDTGRSTAVDIDNFEDALEQFDVKFTLEPHTIRFREMDDFHPDRLLRHPLFEAAEQAAAEPGPEPVSGASVLAQMLGSPEPVARGTRRDWLGEFLDPAMRGATEDRPTAEQADRVRLRDLTKAGLLRGILHHPAFQEREAMWRGLEFLLRAVDGSGNWKIRIVDTAAIPRELPGRCDIAALLYWFGESEQDLEALAGLAAAARAKNATVVGGASPNLLDAEVRPRWSDLRASAGARHVGLAIPRFLLRLPYGAKSDPVDLEGFEEQPVPPVHEKYLWGHPAWLCTALLLQAGRAREIRGLPLHAWKHEGESKSTSCAEAALSESVFERMLDSGLMPLIAPRGEDRVLVPRLQSVSSSPSLLAGRWVEAGSGSE